MVRPPLRQSRMKDLADTPPLELGRFPKPGRDEQVT
jgi:hypothetical protein